MLLRTTSCRCHIPFEWPWLGHMCRVVGTVYFGGKIYEMLVCERGYVPFEQFHRQMYKDYWQKYQYLLGVKSLRILYVPSSLLRVLDLEARRFVLRVPKILPHYRFRYSLLLIIPPMCKWYLSTKKKKSYYIAILFSRDNVCRLPF